MISTKFINKIMTNSVKNKLEQFQEEIKEKLDDVGSNVSDKSNKAFVNITSGVERLIKKTNLMTPIEDINISTFAKKSLRANGYCFAEQLKFAKDEDLLKLPNVGDITVERIRVVLDQRTPIEKLPISEQNIKLFRENDIFYIEQINKMTDEELNILVSNKVLSKIRSYII
jgi:DNA-directed RNA polymerase alpha subunit